MITICFVINPGFSDVNEFLLNFIGIYKRGSINETNGAIIPFSFFLICSKLRSHVVRTANRS